MLAIRPYEESDEPALSAAILRSLDHLRPWVPFADREPVDTEERIRWIRRTRWERATGGDLNFGIFEDGVLVGGCGLHDRVGPRAREVGYWIAVDHAGRGLATAAVALLVDEATAMPSVDRLEVHHDVRNPASGRVAEKNGFVHDRDVTDERGPMRVWVRPSVATRACA